MMDMGLNCWVDSFFSNFTFIVVRHATYSFFIKVYIFLTSVCEPSYVLMVENDLMHLLN
jgi:hypothetical protein